MEVLYPMSYLGISPVFPDPPSYVSGDNSPTATQVERRERTPLNTSTATAGGTRLPSGPHDPLVEAPSLTGVPSPGLPSGKIPPVVEPNAPVVGLGIEVLQEAEPPAYSRFDESRSRLPVASDVLGPYPHISAVLDPPARSRE